MWFAFASAPALAAAGQHVFSMSFGSSGSGAGQLSGPQGVAVDQATGDVYVADTGNARVDEFDSSGNFIQAWGWGVADGASSFETCTTTCEAGSSGSGAGQFETPTFIAVDNSGGPSAGDVYVGDTGDDLVTKFDASGNLVSGWGSGGQLNGSAATSGPFGSLAGITVDTSGSLWVYDQNSNMFEFGQDGSFTTGWNSERGVDPNGIAVDPNGNLYVVVGDGNAEQFSSTGSDIGDVTDDTSDTITGLAVDPSTSDFYADDGGSLIRHYLGSSLSSCVPTNGCTAADTFGSGDLSSAAGLAVDSASDTVYAADSGDDRVDAFGPLPVSPSIDSASATNVSSNSADLNAQINPNRFDTTYHFEWGTADCATSACTSVPVPDADIGSGSSDVSVSQHITGLTANTEYHFRVVATNTVGTTSGVDHTFVYDTAGGGLPDGRAYEMVTPVDKAGALVSPQPATDPSGSSLVGSSTGAFAGLTDDELPAEGAAYYRFTRTGSGWTTTPLTCCRLQPASIGVGDSVWFPANTPTATPDHLWLLAGDGSLSDIGPVSPQPGSGYEVLGAAADASNGVVFSITDQSLLWPFDSAVNASVGSYSLYEYTGTGNTAPTLVGVSGGAGSTSLISQCGTILGSPAAFGSTYNAVSESGQTVFFTALGADDNNTSGCTGAQPPVDELFARVGGSQTDAISEPSSADCSTCNTSTPADALFEGASADGSKVFFTTAQPLLPGDTDTTTDLYEYDFDAPAGQKIIQVSAGGAGDATPGSGADVEGVSRISEDGSHVYFVADGVLTTQANSEGHQAQAGASNLYLYERDAEYPAGRTAFIAELCSGAGSSGAVADPQCPSNLNSDPWNYGANHNDQRLWSHGDNGGDFDRPAQATPDGRFLVFTSYGDLTADDTSNARQVFLYDAQSGKLTRVSIGQNGFNDNGNTDLGDASIVAAPYTVNAGGAVVMNRGGEIAYTMSDDGSYVFFESPVGLTPQALDRVAIDSSGDLAENVYEYHDGQVGLISDGRDTSLLGGGASGVSLDGTDASGADVFFTTVDQLVPQDTDTQFDIYDARIGGGFPAPSPPAACVGDACQGTPSAAPAVPIAASVTFSGPGNEAAEAMAKVKVIKKRVKGTTFLLTVKVPGRGRIAITGAGVRTVRRSVARARTYKLRVTLTAKEKKALKRKRKLRLRLRVAYTSVTGSRSSVGFSITDRA